MDNNIPPRPKRIEFATSKEYHRAYENWRSKYDPGRRARRLVRSRRYYEENRDRLLDQKREQYRDEPGKFLARQAQWRTANRDKLKARDQRRYDIDPGVAREEVRTATPPWVDADMLLEMAAKYAEARRMTKATGVRYCVDHVWPLNGKRSCGLHVPWNLQIIRLSENSSKQNREPSE
jgi:hypothetical protein